MLEKPDNAKEDLNQILKQLSPPVKEVEVQRVVSMNLETAALFAASIQSEISEFLGIQPLEEQSQMITNLTSEIEELLSKLRQVHPPWLKRFIRSIRTFVAMDMPQEEEQSIADFLESFARIRDVLAVEARRHEEKCVRLDDFLVRLAAHISTLRAASPQTTDPVASLLKLREESLVDSFVALTFHQRHIVLLQSEKLKSLSLLVGSVYRQVLVIQSRQGR